MINNGLIVALSIKTALFLWGLRLVSFTCFLQLTGPDVHVTPRYHGKKRRTCSGHVSRDCLSLSCDQVTSDELCLPVWILISMQAVMGNGKWSFSLDAVGVLDWLKCYLFLRMIFFIYRLIFVHILYWTDVEVNYLKILILSPIWMVYVFGIFYCRSVQYKCKNLSIINIIV